MEHSARPRPWRVPAVRPAASQIRRDGDLLPMSKGAHPSKQPLEDRMPRLKGVGAQFGDSPGIDLDIEPKIDEMSSAVSPGRIASKRNTSTRSSGLDPIRKRNTFLCEACRKARKKCSPDDRTWIAGSFQKCERCQRMGLPCGPGTQASAQRRLSGPISSPYNLTQLELSGTSQPAHVQEPLEAYFDHGLRRPRPYPSSQILELSNFNSSRTADGQSISPSLEWFMPNPIRQQSPAGGSTDFNVEWKSEDLSGMGDLSISPRLYGIDHKPSSQAVILDWSMLIKDSTLLETNDLLETECQTAEFSVADRAASILFAEIIHQLSSQQTKHHSRTLLRPTSTKVPASGEDTGSGAAKRNRSAIENSASCSCNVSKSKRRKAADGVEPTSDTPDQVKLLVKKKYPDESLRQFACLHFKADPKIHKHCLLNGFNCFNELRQHIRRKHHVPIHCPVCFMEFKLAGRRDAHIRDQSCIKRESPFAADLLDADKYRQTDKVNDECDYHRWFRCFALVFPGKPLPESPYEDSFFNHAYNLFGIHPDGAYQVYEELLETGVGPPLPELRQEIVDAAWDRFWDRFLDIPLEVQPTDIHNSNSGQDYAQSEQFPSASDHASLPVEDDDQPNSPAASAALPEAYAIYRTQIIGIIQRGIDLEADGQPVPNEAQPSAAFMGEMEPAPMPQLGVDALPTTTIAGSLYSGETASTDQQLATPDETALIDQQLATSDEADLLFSDELFSNLTAGTDFVMVGFAPGNTKSHDTEIDIVSED